MSNGNCTGYQVKKSGFQTWWGYCVVFLGKVLFSHSASIHSRVKTGTSKLSGEPDEMLWGVCVFV